MKIVNRTYDALAVGDSAELRRLITPDDLYVFAASSGNFNPMHLPGGDGDSDGDGAADGGAQTVAPGMFLASLISAVLGTQLPGPGTRYKSQSLQFHGPAHAGDDLLCRVSVLEKQPEGRLRLQTVITRPADGATLVNGEATVIAPTVPFARNDLRLPGLIVQRHRHFDALLDRVADLPPLATAVVCPHDATALSGAMLAAERQVIRPLLVGDPDLITKAARDAGQALQGVEVVPAGPTDQDAARKACALVREGRAGAVMKGHLHTDAFLRPLLDATSGLRIGRRLTHAFVMDVPGLAEPLLVTDAAINIAPDLQAKVDIVQNAIDLALALGFGEPRVGILSAVETVNPAIPSSVDAALLAKMAERGQIRGGQVDGPLAMDNALDLQAARIKGLSGGVAGHANVLVVPGIDAGNILVKQMSFVSHAEAAGIVLGARVPVILTSRADGPMARLVSCAVAVLHHAWQTARAV